MRKRGELRRVVVRATAYLISLPVPSFVGGEKGARGRSGTLRGPQGVWVVVRRVMTDDGSGGVVMKVLLTGVADVNQEAEEPAKTLVSIRTVSRGYHLSV